MGSVGKTVCLWSWNGGKNKIFLNVDTEPDQIRFNVSCRLNYTYVTVK